MPTVLLTGATGYIGSHTWLALLAAGFDVVGLDNFSNSSPVVLDRLRQLSGQTPTFVEADVCDADALARVLCAQRLDACVHFAAFKAVGESTHEPLKYYANNVGGLVTLCQALHERDCRRFVFSSSATVYGLPTKLPLTEDMPCKPYNAYGRTKAMGEALLGDLSTADPNWQNAILRYFNPIGAHPSGLIGEDPRGLPNNLMPYVTQVAVGRREVLNVFGDDYDTPDGTGVRDYIHVSDLAEGHVAALKRLLAHPGSFTLNLGTGRGTSVLELVRAFEAASDCVVPLHVGPRRDGDVDACWADASLARELLAWSAERDVETMCADSWRWQSQNPQGFGA